MIPIPTTPAVSSLKKTKKKLIFDGKPLTPAVVTPVVIATDVIVTPAVAVVPAREKLATEEGYIQSLTEKEHKAYLIAQSHLMTSFSLKKSNGYLNYISSIQSSPAYLLVSNIFIIKYLKNTPIHKPRTITFSPSYFFARFLYSS